VSLLIAAGAAQAQKQGGSITVGLELDIAGGEEFHLSSPGK
jgi:hypothetical protein